MKNGSRRNGQEHLSDHCDRSRANEQPQNRLAHALPRRDVVERKLVAAVFTRHENPLAAGCGTGNQQFLGHVS